MSANIIRFPRRDRGAIRVCREDDWVIVYDGRAWPHGSREAALQKANELALELNAGIIVEAPRC